MLRSCKRPLIPLLSTLFTVRTCRMDDVEDNSELRRGIPVAHTIYGIPQTINTANYVYFLAMQELLRLRVPGKANDKGKEKEVDIITVVTGKPICANRGSYRP